MGSGSSTRRKDAIKTSDSTVVTQEKTKANLPHPQDTSSGHQHQPDSSSVESKAAPEEGIDDYNLDDDIDYSLFSEGLSHSALAFDIDQDDLLFNLLYFNENNGTQGLRLDDIMEETVAAHSPGNTPYKLKRASDKLQSDHENELCLLENGMIDDNECAICKDVMEIECKISYLKHCKHCFHQDCFIRWIRLQAVCPVCRCDLEASVEQN